MFATGSMLGLASLRWALLSSVLVIACLWAVFYTSVRLPNSFGQAGVDIVYRISLQQLYRSGAGQLDLAILYLFIRTMGFRIYQV